MSDFAPWLRGLAKKGGKGVVDNIDARCLGRVADTIEAQADEIERMQKALKPFAKLELWIDAYPDGPIDGRRQLYRIPTQDILEARAALRQGE